MELLLALTDISADRARIVVLEVVQRQAAGSTHLVGDCLARSARVGHDCVRVARRYAVDGLDGLAGTLVVERGLLASIGIALRELQTSRARDGEGRSLKVLLLWEKEDQSAGVARVRLGNVEVEERADIAIGLSVVGGSRGVGRLGRRDGHDQVRVLVLAVQIGRAAVSISIVAGLSGSWGSRRLSWLRRCRLGWLRGLAFLGRLRSGWLRFLRGLSRVRLLWRWRWRWRSLRLFRRLRSRRLRLLWRWSRLRLFGRLRRGRLAFLGGNRVSCLGLLRRWSRGTLGRLRWSRLGGGSTRLVAPTARWSRTQCDLDALILTRSRLGVYVVFSVVVHWACVELCVSVIGDGSSVDGKAVGWAGANVALELGCGRSQDATTALAVGEAAVSIEAVAGRTVIPADTVLTVRQLAKGA